MADISHDTIEAAIDAAIEWDVRLGTATMAFIKQGGLYVFQSPSGGGTQIFPARGGSVSGIEATQGLTITTAEEFMLDNGESAAACYKKWEDRLYQLSYLFKTIPRPEDFQSAVDAFDPILSTLAVNPALVPTTDSAGQESLDFDVTGNDQFTLIGSAASSFTTFQGLTSDTFRKYYLDRFPLIVQRQYGVAQMLEIAVRGEQAIWEALNKDVKTMFDDLRTSFEKGGAVGGGGDSAQGLAIVGAVAGVVGVIPGVNVAVATGVAVAGAIAGVLSLLPLPEEEKVTYAFTGETPDEVWSKVDSDGLHKLRESSRKQEQAIADHMTTIRTMIQSDPGSWDLGRIDDGDGDGRSASDELQDETNVSGVIGVKMNFDIARATGQDLITVSAEFKKASSDLDGVMASGAWSRSGELGMGYIGHYQETNALVEELYGILHGTELGLQRGGEVIQIAADELERQDGDVNSDLRKHAEAVDAADATPLPR
jgi:hypothetical protein